MKIKVCFGIDTRLWRHNLKTEDKPNETTYRALCNYICQTFNFDSFGQFKISLQQENMSIPITNAADLKAAYVSAHTAKQKSFKLFVEISKEKDKLEDEAEEKAEEKVCPIQSSIAIDDLSEQQHASDVKVALHGFFDNEQVCHELSNLLIAVLQTMKECNCEISMMDCLEGVLLSSDNNDYQCIVSHDAWPYIRYQLLPKRISSMEHIIIPMLKSGFNIDAVKPMINGAIQMMKYRRQQQQQQSVDDVLTYTQEMADIMNMGFTNHTVIRQLLIKHRGNKAAVVNQLIQSHKQ